MFHSFLLDQKKLVFLDCESCETASNWAVVSLISEKMYLWICTLKVCCTSSLNSSTWQFEFLNEGASVDEMWTKVYQSIQLGAGVNYDAVNVLHP